MEKQHSKLQEEEVRKISEINEMKANAQRDHQLRKKVQEELDHVMN